MVSDKHKKRDIKEQICLLDPRKYNKKGTEIEVEESTLLCEQVYF